MPQDTSASLHDPSTPAVARLVDTAERDQPTTPRDVAGQLQSGGFFWLDLENPDEGELAEFCQSLRLSADAIESVTHAGQRSSLALAAVSQRRGLKLRAVDDYPDPSLDPPYEYPRQPESIQGACGVAAVGAVRERSTL